MLVPGQVTWCGITVGVVTCQDRCCWIVCVQVPEFIKLICKVFWSATFMEIPQLLVQQEQFQGWMMAFHTAMRKQLPWVRFNTSYGCIIHMPLGFIMFFELLWGRVL